MRAHVNVRLSDGTETVGHVELDTAPTTFDRLEHDVEVTANLDGIWLPDGRNVHVGHAFGEVEWFDLIGEPDSF